MKINYNEEEIVLSGLKEKFMNKDKEKNEMREEYDFSKGVRGKHYQADAKRL